MRAENGENLLNLCFCTGIRRGGKECLPMKAARRRNDIMAGGPSTYGVGSRRCWLNSAV